LDWDFTYTNKFKPDAQVSKQSFIALDFDVMTKTRIQSRHVFKADLAELAASLANSCAFKRKRDCRPSSTITANATSSLGGAMNLCPRGTNQPPLKLGSATLPSKTIGSNSYEGCCLANSKWVHPDVCMYELRESLPSY
jgi:hypothetical protein